MQTKPNLIVNHLEVMARAKKPLLLYGKSKNVELALEDVSRTNWEFGVRFYLTDKNDDGVEHEAEISDLSLLDWQGYSGVFLVDREIDEIVSGHKAMALAKDNALPVVSPYERMIYTQKPKGIQMGINYQGMFTMAGYLARSLRQPGDYLEFGVFDGCTMTLAYHAIGSLIPNMRFIGFDSFSGISGGMPNEIGKYPEGAYYSNEETFWHNMQVAGVEKGRVKVVRGNMLETLKDPQQLAQQLGLTRCLVAHIDCDVYQAAKAALTFLTNYLVEGSLLMFDEYDQWAGSNGLGERKALSEWLSENPQFSVEPYREYAWAARSFIVHVDKKPRAIGD